MASTDLSAVTATLKNLINFILVENGEMTITATAAPPDASSSENLVSVYLYHVVESPEFKNLPPTNGSGPVPIQHAPMGLVLQYIITVIHGASDTISNDAVMAEQKILGFVARAIHDFPVISETTRVPGTTNPVLHPDIAAQRNTIRLNLRPATREETVTFWSSSDDKLPRLSLFVEARVAILDPRAPTVLPGIVLTVGNFVFPGAGPQFTVTTSDIRFFAPDLETGTLVLRQVTASPARGTLLPLVVAPPLTPPLDLNNTVTIDAVGIRPGRHLLTLRGPSGEFRVDMSAATNPDWAFDVQSNRVQFRLRREVVDEHGNNVVLDLGVYTARITVEAAQFGGKPQSSNEVPFTAIPQIAAITPAGTNTYELRIAGDYFLISPPPLSPLPKVSEEDIVLAISGVTLTPVAFNATLAAGQFQILTAATSTPSSTLRFQLPSGLPTPQPTEPLPVGLIVKGAPATPAWIREVAP